MVHIIWSILYGPNYLDCLFTSVNWTLSLASYWTSGWIYGVVTANDYACAYYEYFSNWVDTMLLIYFLYQLGLILFEYKAMQNLVNNDLDEIVKHPSWKTLRGRDKNETHWFLSHRVIFLMWWKLHREISFYLTIRCCDEQQWFAYSECFMVPLHRNILKLNWAWQCLFHNGYVTIWAKCKLLYSVGTNCTVQFVQFWISIMSNNVLVAWYFWKVLFP